MPAVTPADVEDTAPLETPDRGGVPGRHDGPGLGRRRRGGRDRGAGADRGRRRGRRRRCPHHRGRGGRPRAAAGAHHRAGRPRVRHPRAGRGRGRPPALPVLRRPARRGRARLPHGPTATAAEAPVDERPIDVGDRAGPAAPRRDHRRGPAGRRLERDPVLRASSCDGADARCVYKPVAGERPLWDFPDGTLAGREVAAYALSEATGWGLVPPTVLRDGPVRARHVPALGDTDDGRQPRRRGGPHAVPDGWLRVLDALGAGGEPVVLAHADDPRLRRMAVLDVVINNADRKGGHVLPGRRRRARRRPRRLPSIASRSCARCCGAGPGSRSRRRGRGARAPGRGLDGALGAELAALLDRREVRACRRRVDRLLQRPPTCRTPLEGWPAIPWPPF